jgi:hypothetical protein
LSEREERQPRAVLLNLPEAILEQAPIYSGYANSAERYVALARALSASPWWAAMQDAVMVVRPEPPARLAVLGRFSEDEAVRLEALGGQVDGAIRRLRYIGHAEAEQTAAELAERLVERVGWPAVDAAQFVALPRGGHFVLGMLSYLLDLRPDQLDPSRPETAPLIVVDDCALTGLRFGRFLKDHADREVIFGHLFSHPDLRAAIECREPAVSACVSGRDLDDLAPAEWGDEYGVWLERWRARSDPDVYWVGLPGHVCFAWNEPDVTIWNPVTEREEAAWRVVPPEWCLKNRRLGPGPSRLQIQPVGDSRSRIRPGPDVVYGTIGDDLVAANCATGKAFGFSRMAREIWESLLRHGDPVGVVEEIATRYEVEASVLESDVAAFAEDAMGKGLLERRNE